MNTTNDDCLECRYFLYSSKECWNKETCTNNSEYDKEEVIKKYNLEDSYYERI